MTPHVHGVEVSTFHRSEVSIHPSLRENLQTYELSLRISSLWRMERGSCTSHLPLVMKT